MGQVLRKDKIGTLSESGGTISMQPSVLTIGGQQYVTGTLTVPTRVVAKNQRYQVFAVLESGVPALVVSINENSQGPTGYTAWKLVGSYYTDGLTASTSFGSWVNISGVPKSGPINFDPTGGWNNTTYSGKWRRFGGFLKADYQLLLTGAPTGNASVNKPGNMTIDQSKMLSTVGSGDIPCGTWAGEDISIQHYSGFAFYRKSTDIIFASIQVGVVNPTSPFSWNSGDYMDIEVDELPITGWSNTPIEDL